MNHIPSKPKPRLFRWIFIVLCVIVVALAAGFVLAQQARIDTAVSLAEYRKSVVVDQQAAYDELLHQYQQVTDDCAEAAGCFTSATPPSLIPDSDQVAKSVPGAAGRDGLAGSRGDRGDPGERGDIGIPGQTGPPGVNGSSGPAGVDGKAGADGSPGSGGERGPGGSAGADGAPGAAGQAGLPGLEGRGLSSITCELDGSWLVTYTDASTTITPGPCRISIPTPTPEGNRP